MGKYLIILLTVLACACCASAPPKARIFGALPLEPEIWYEDIYKEVTRCARSLNKYSGLEYAALEFYVVEADAIPGMAGLFSSPRRIYFDARFVITASVIRHEMAHAALIWGFNRHDDASFKLCAGETNGSN